MSETGSYTFTTVEIADIKKPACRVERPRVQAWIDFVKNGGKGSALVLWVDDDGCLEPLEEPKGVLAKLLAAEESGYDAIKAYVLRSSKRQAEEIRLALAELGEEVPGEQCRSDGQHLFRGLDLRRHGAG